MDALPSEIKGRVTLLDMLCIRCDFKFLEIVISTFMLMSVFYLGPIIVSIAHIVTKIRFNVGSDGSLGPHVRKRSFREILKILHEEAFMRSQQFTNQEFFRNFLFAPFSEEIVFRVLMVPYLYASLVLPSLKAHIINSDTGGSITYGCSQIPWIIGRMGGPWAVALVCPTFFGLAHLHHMIEKIRSGTPLTSALTSTLVQFTYTSIFGLIATLLLMRTSCFLSPLLSHIYCNFMGLPDLGYLKAPVKSYFSSPLSHLFRFRYILLFMNALGLIMFAILLFPLTEKFATSSILWPRVS